MKTKRIRDIRKLEKESVESVAKPINKELTYLKISESELTSLLETGEKDDLIISTESIDPSYTSKEDFLRTFYKQIINILINCDCNASDCIQYRNNLLFEHSKLTPCIPLSKEEILANFTEKVLKVFYHSPITLKELKKEEIQDSFYELFNKLSDSLDYFYFSIPERGVDSLRRPYEFKRRIEPSELSMSNLKLKEPDFLPPSIHFSRFFVNSKVKRNILYTVLNNIGDFFTLKLENIDSLKENIHFGNNFSNFNEHSYSYDLESGKAKFYPISYSIFVKTQIRLPLFFNNEFYKKGWGCNLANDDGSCKFKNENEIILELNRSAIFVEEKERSYLTYQRKLRPLLVYLFNLKVIEGFVFNDDEFYEFKENKSFINRDLSGVLITVFTTLILIISYFVYNRNIKNV